MNLAVSRLVLSVKQPDPAAGSHGSVEFFPIQQMTLMPVVCKE